MTDAKRYATQTTLYLRSVPVDVVREAKAAAYRRGSTLGALVTESLQRSLSGEQETDAGGGDDLKAEMEWYEQHRSRLAKRYAGQYVAIVDGRVIDHDAEFGALAARVFASVGVRPVFMPRVGEPTREARIRSPRRS